MINTINHLFNSQLYSIKNSHSKYYQSCFDYSWNLYSKDLKAHYGCVNAIEFSNRESEHIASGGDDRRVLLWSINNDVLTSDKSNPVCLKTQHHSNIFTLAWDNENRKIFSGGNDDQVLVHDVQTQQIIDIFLHSDAVFCISVHPTQSEIFASACENGQVSLYDLRLSNTDPIILSETVHGSAYQACCFNPTNSSLIATANIESGLQLIDLRMQNKVLLKYEAKNDNSAYKSDKDKNVVMSVKFNQSGSQLLALRSKWAPVLYNLNDPKPIIQFDHEDFLNSCTLKSCCFAGDRDQYVCSGSDDFCVYIWKIMNDSTNKLHLKLKGHRSIVNQVRYHPNLHLLISSGVEKIIKCWTPFKLESSIGGLKGNKDEYLPLRKLYTNRELFELRWLPQPMTGNSNNNVVNVDSLNLYQSMEEDQTMIAFFDSLVRKELNNWSSEDIIDDDDDNENNRNINEYDDESTSDSSDTSILDTSRSDSDSDDENKSNNNSRQELIEFLSDNEHEQYTSDSSSSSNVSIDLGSTSQSSKTNKKRISLRDRLRNLRHRKSLNLTESSDYTNLLDSLNVPHGDLKKNEENQNLLDKALSSSTNNKANNESVADKEQMKNNDFKTKINLEEKNKIKTLNQQRRMIELDADEQNNFTIDKPTTSNLNTSFKKSRKISENNHETNETRQYRYNKNDFKLRENNDTSSSSDDDKNKCKNPKKRKK